MIRRLTLLAIVSAAACGFHPSADITALDAGGTTDASQLDDARDLDANHVVPADAAPVVVTLRQTATDTPSSGHSDQCLTAGPATHAEAYARLFVLATAWHLTRVDFDASAQNASGIIVHVGIYSGDPADTTLGAGAITWLAQTPAFSVADGDVFSHAALDADLPQSANMIIAIASPDYASGSTFAIEGASGGETGPSYWQAPGCSTTDLAERDGRNNADVGTFIIDAEGYAP